MSEEKVNTIIKGESRIFFNVKKGTKVNKMFGSFNGMIGIDKKFQEIDNEKFIELVEQGKAFDLTHIKSCSYKGDIFTITIPHEDVFMHETAILFGLLE